MANPYPWTHNGRQAKTWTAFHEAWAEFAKNELYRQMFGQGATIYGGDRAERRPYTRAELKADMKCGTGPGPDL